MTIRYAIPCVVLAVVSTGCIADKHPPAVVPPAATLPVPAALRYSLPRTTLVVELQVELATQTPGKFCDFLDVFFPDLDHAVACQIGDAPALETGMVVGEFATTIQGYSVTLKGTPDTDRVHDVNFDASWHVERADSFMLTENGTLTGADVQRTDRTAEIVLGIASNVAKIAGRFVFGGAGVAIAKQPVSDEPWELIPALKENFGLLGANRQKAYKDLWKTADGKRRLTLATRSYQGVVADSATLDSLLKGAGAVAAQTLITELRKQIADRVSDDFVGASKKDIWNPVYEITPDQPLKGEHQNTYALFTFTACGVTREGLRPVKNPLGALACSKTGGAPESEVRFSVTTASMKDAGRLSFATPQPTDTKGVLYYIRPEPVTLNLQGTCKATFMLADKGPKLIDPTTKVCAMVAQPSLLAQWGVEATIPAAGKDFAYTVALYEATGAIKSIKLSSKALLDKTTIDSAFGVATTLLDAKAAADAEAKKKADAAAAAADELNVLTRRRQILDEKAKIKKLCVDLGLTDCES